MGRTTKKGTAGVQGSAPVAPEPPVSGRIVELKVPGGLLREVLQVYDELYPQKARTQKFEQALTPGIREKLGEAERMEIAEVQRGARAAELISAAVFLGRDPVGILFDQEHRDRVDRVVENHKVDALTMFHLFIEFTKAAAEDPRLLESVRRDIRSKGGSRSGEARKEKEQKTRDRILRARDKRVAQGMKWTQKWLAEKCKVSVPTVAKALNNSK